MSDNTSTNKTATDVLNALSRDDATFKDLERDSSTSSSDRVLMDFMQLEVDSINEELGYEALKIGTMEDSRVLLVPPKFNPNIHFVLLPTNRIYLNETLSTFRKADTLSQGSSGSTSKSIANSELKSSYSIYKDRKSIFNQRYLLILSRNEEYVNQYEFNITTKSQLIGLINTLNLSFEIKESEDNTATDSEGSINVDSNQ